MRDGERDVPTQQADDVLLASRISKAGRVMTSVRWSLGLIGCAVLAGCTAAPGYSVSEHRVTYAVYDPQGGYTVRTVDDADPATFKVFPGQPPGSPRGFRPRHYGRDATTVYFIDDPVPGADPTTFRVLEHSYAVDARNGYYSGGTIGVLDPGREPPRILDPRRRTVDPATFEVLSENLSRDAGGMLYRSPGDRANVHAFDACDPQGFDKSFGVQGVYWRDGVCAYFQDQRLESADPATFRVFPPARDVRWHAADANSVYMWGWRIAGADPATYEALPYGYGRDAERVYYGALEYDREAGREVLRRPRAIDADPATFEAIPPRWNDAPLLLFPYLLMLTGEWTYDARDSRGCLLEGERVACASD